MEIFPERVRISYPSLIATRSYQPPPLRERNGGITFSVRLLVTMSRTIIHRPLRQSRSFFLFGGKRSANTTHTSQLTTRASRTRPIDYR